MIVFQVLYTASAIVLALISFNALILSLIYLRHCRDNVPLPDDKDLEWPSVVVQLPIYNEREVVERLVEAVSRLDYPRDRLAVQLLDDSTDETTAIAAAATERARQRGLSIEHIRRGSRAGFKAGALRAGLQRTQAEFVAVFDADFVPPPDFLRQVLPYFKANERLGMVQTRWGHLNADYSILTRAQALALDVHFVVEQTARHRGGLLMNFAGTGGVWRRSCIEASGGWHSDTLSEDIDLSYRAQLAGWQCLYLPDVAAPAEITPAMMAFKRQQARWATGTIQCLRKLGPTVLKSRLSLWQKAQAMLHLGGYFIHPFMLLLLLTALPLMQSGQSTHLPLAGLGLAMLGLPLQNLLAQRRLYSHWAGRLSAFPVLLLMGVGIAVSNTLGVARGFSPGPQTFHRTPKYNVQRRGQSWVGARYAAPMDHTPWLEIALAIYAGVTGMIALDRAPSLVPFMALYTLGFAYVAGTSLWQARAARRVEAHARCAPHLTGAELGAANKSEG